MLQFRAYTVLLLLFCTVALLFGYSADQPQVCEFSHCHCHCQTLL